MLFYAKVKRIIADIIDICIIFIFGLILNVGDAIASNTIDSILLIITMCILFIIKDSFFKCSIGKSIFKIQIYNRDNSLCNEKKRILRNIINLLTLTISVVTILLYNKTIGDVLCKTYMGLNKHKQKVNSYKISKIVLVIYLVMQLVILIFFQKINCESLNYIFPYLSIIAIIVYSIFKNLEIKHSKVLCIAWIIISITIIDITTDWSNNYEKTIVFSNINDLIEYSYPKSDIVYIENIEDDTIVILNDSNNIYHYRKINNIYQIEPYKTDFLNNLTYYIIQDMSLEEKIKYIPKEYSISYKKNYDQETTYILVNQFKNKCEKVTDLNKENYDNIKIRNSCIYFIKKDVIINNNEYYIMIGNKKVDFKLYES